MACSPGERAIRRATGVGILASRSPAPWLWARVAGDGLDMATLRSAAAFERWIFSKPYFDPSGLIALIPQRQAVTIVSPFVWSP